MCPAFHAAVELIGKRWSGAIIWALREGPLYFAEVAAAVPGLSDRLLSERLRELEGAGLVERAVHDEAPPRVSYRLSKMGLDLEPILSDLAEWGRRWDLGQGAGGEA